MGRRTVQNISLVLVSVVLSLLLIEFGTRWFVLPSKNSYGRLFGEDLPPIKIFQGSLSPPPTDFSEWYDHMIVDGEKITKGDLWGIHKQDPLLTYRNEENRISTNGWWQSNNIGARSRLGVGKEIPPGRK